MGVSFLHTYSSCVHILPSYRSCVHCVVTNRSSESGLTSLLCPADQNIQPISHRHVGRPGRVHGRSRALGYVQPVLHALLDQCDVAGRCHLPSSPRP